MISLPVGIDVSKDTLDVCIYFNEESTQVGQFTNDTEGFNQIDAVLQSHKARVGADEIHLVCEPTGGYQAALVAFAYEQEWKISLPNPAQVRDWASGIGIRAKTDKQDAYMLARFAAERKPTPTGQLPSEIAQLDSLLRRRDLLSHIKRQERNRKHIYSRQPEMSDLVESNVDLMLSFIDDALSEVDAGIKALLKQYPELAQAAKRLQSMPGIGDKLVLPMLVLLYRWEVLTNGEGSAKKLTAYLGLDPKPHRSGTSVNKRARISRQGNRPMRSRLYMGALGGVTGHNALKVFYQTHGSPNSKAGKTIIS